MRDINKLLSRAMIERVWMANYSVMIHEPKCTLDTQGVVKILDAKCEHANLNAVVEENCSHLGASDQEKLLKLLTKLEDLFNGK